MGLPHSTCEWHTTAATGHGQAQRAVAVCVQTTNSMTLQLQAQAMGQLLTFGWNISLVKRTRGGLSGYCSLKVMRSWNTPPCKVSKEEPTAERLE